MSSSKESLAIARDFNLRRERATKIPGATPDGAFRKGLRQQSAGEVANRIPDSEEADDEHRDEDQHDVFGMDTNGIGVDDEVACGGTETHQSVLLLEPTEQQTEKDTDDGADGRDESALEEEDADDLAIAGTKVAQSNDIVFLIDNQHGVRAVDVETGHHEDEGEEVIGYKLLDLHDLKGIVLLFEAVAHDKLGSGKTLYL